MICLKATSLSSTVSNRKVTRQLRASQRSNTKNFQLWLIAWGFGCMAIRPFEKPACFLLFFVFQQKAFTKNFILVLLSLIWYFKASLQMFLKPFFCNLKEANEKEFHQIHQIVVQSLASSNSNGPISSVEIMISVYGFIILDQCEFLKLLCPIHICSCTFAQQKEPFYSFLRS